MVRYCTSEKKNVCFTVGSRVTRSLPWNKLVLTVFAVEDRGGRDPPAGWMEKILRVAGERCERASSCGMMMSNRDPANVGETFFGVLIGKARLLVEALADDDLRQDDGVSKKQSSRDTGKRMRT